MSPGSVEDTDVAHQERLRIGDVAEQTGCTARSIRYWEEVGLLPSGSRHEKGRHRTYSHDDVDRIHALVRTRELLGINLEHLREAYETERSRSEIRTRWREDDLGDDERRLLLAEAVGHIDVQLRLVAERRASLTQFEAELQTKRRDVQARIDGLASPMDRPIDD